MEPRDPNYEQRKLALIEEITAAFDGVSREDGIGLHEAQAMESYGNSDEIEQARKKDTEARWQDIPAEEIYSNGSALIFLDPIGFRYCIPAFLVWYLNNIDNKTVSGSTAFDGVIFRLAPNSEEFDSYQFQLFTPQQCKAVARFLVLEAERMDDVWSHMTEKHIQTFMQKGYSPKEIAQHRRKEAQIGDTYNSAKSALQNYWGQFL